MDETELGDYSKLTLQQLPQKSLQDTPESKWWRRFEPPILQQHVGSTSHVEYQQQAPHNVLITSATRLFVYDYFTQRLKRQFTRFPSTAYCGTFRSDGKMIAAGGDTGIVQVFNVNSRDILRQFRGHRSPVRTVCFSRADNTHLMSGGDDATVRYWDISLGEEVSKFTGHMDYVRCMTTSQAQPDLWLTGSYDHTCKLWDIRLPNKQNVRSWQHAPGAPVEDVIILPSGTMAVSAGSTMVRLWDMLSGKLIASMNNHQKTVTSLKHVSVDAAMGEASTKWKPGARLITGSIDGHLKIYELDTFSLTHSTKYPDAILSFDVAKNGLQLAVGMANGMLAVRKRKKAKVLEASLQESAKGGKEVKRERWKPVLTASSYRYFIRGQTEKLTAEIKEDTSIAVAQRRKSVNLKAYDKALKKFRYREALDEAILTRDPNIVLSVLEHLAARGGDGHALKAALAQRNASSLLPIMKFLCKSISDPRMTKVSVTVCHALLEQYAPVVGIAPDFDAKIMLLYERVKAELHAQDQLIQLQGMLEPLLFAQYNTT